MWFKNGSDSVSSYKKTIKYMLMNCWECQALEVI